MSLVDSLIVSLLGLFVVFLVLILLCLLIKVLSVILRSVQQKNQHEAYTANKSDEGNVPTYSIISGTPEMPGNGFSAGELQLFGVDEKTAALIMAIVSDECKIPLCELQFKTIKAID